MLYSVAIKCRISVSGAVQAFAEVSDLEGNMLYSQPLPKSRLAGEYVLATRLTSGDNEVVALDKAVKNDEELLGRRSRGAVDVSIFDLA